MFLPADTFKTIVEFTPLISMDLIVEDHNGNILLGKRNNPPAKDFWFVPGGRILKNETLENAFSRLTKNELNIDIPYNQAEFLGVYEHFYEDSIFGNDISTHYVVLAYKIRCNHLSQLPPEQHSEYSWLSKKDILEKENIHSNTKLYFK